MVKNKKNEQHIVPRTYLKHWSIETNKSFVYGIDFSNIHRTDIQLFGLNHKVFKQRRYYNDNTLENPYQVEDLLADGFEPSYEEIMSNINLERKLSPVIVSKIMQWIYVSKMRSPFIRNNTKNITHFIYEILEKYNGSFTTETKKDIELKSEKLAKQIQLSTLLDISQIERLFKLFVNTLNVKHWRILKSSPELPFWTNDNPGFSPNMDKRFRDEYPFHHVIELNSSSIVFYPLSPKYCLEISPLVINTPLNVCALNMDILYEQAPIKLIEFINKGVLFTCNKVIISNDRNVLERYVKFGDKSKNNIYE